jgi:hypothetical protein
MEMMNVLKASVREIATTVVPRKVDFSDDPKKIQCHQQLAPLGSYLSKRY